MQVRDLVDSRPTLVLSPHMDDAILSAFAVCSGVECDVWTTFAGLPVPAQATAWDASCGFTSSDETIRARRAEDDRAFEGLACRPRRLDAWEGAYATRERQKSNLAMIEREVRAWLREHPRATVVVPIAAGCYVPPSRLENVRDRLRPPASHAAQADSVSDAAALNATSEHVPAHGARAVVKKALPLVLRPARRAAQATLHAAYQRRRRRAQLGGMAHNPDHLMLRDLALSLASEFPNARVVLCEDLPYLWHESGDLQAGLLRRHGLALREVSTPVDAAAKFAHLQAYASQMSLLDPAGRLRDPDAIPETERYWVVENSVPREALFKPTPRHESAARRRKRYSAIPRS